MSAAIERRMAKLEEATRPNQNRIDILFRRIVCTVGNEAVHAVIGDRVVDRRVDESEDTFRERAKVAALAATTHRPCRVILLPEDALK